ncbi:MAG: nuclear transport factor 2 family protein [Solirubrobacterales bacterium]
MSQENVEVVRVFFDARNRRDLDALLACLSADAQFDLSESRSPYRGRYVGHEQVRRVFEDLFEAWENFELSLEDPVEAGDQVVVSVLVRASGRGSGVQLQGQGANVFTVRNGEIVGFRLFQSRDQALEAAGLSE